VGKKIRVMVEPGTLAHAAYGRTEAEEVYRCDFGLDPGRHASMEEGGLRVSGTDAGGEARILEPAGHPFCVATLFVPQLSSSVEEPHPLVAAFLRAAIAGARGPAGSGAMRGRLARP
jgi:CTP synthase (UTP-ammonia lyase)